MPIDQESATLAWRLVLPSVADLHDATLRSLLRAYPTLLKLCPDALAYVAVFQPPPQIVAHVYEHLPSLPYDAALYCRDAAHTSATMEAFNAFAFALQCTKGDGGTWEPNRFVIYKHAETLTIKIKQPNGLSVIMAMYKLPRTLDIKYIAEMICGERTITPPVVFLRKVAPSSSSSYTPLLRHSSNDSDQEEVVGWPPEMIDPMDEDDDYSMCNCDFVKRR